jgi:hypothetical protein
MRADTQLPLLCGLCPNRRVLCYLWFFPSWRLVAPAPPPPPRRVRERHIREGHPGGLYIGDSDFERPGDAQELAQELGPSWQVGQRRPPIRRRCRLGHPWTLSQDQLVPAFERAIADGRGELVAPFDFAEGHPHQRPSLGT